VVTSVLAVLVNLESAPTERESAEVAAGDIRAVIAGTHMLFITAGTDGGTAVGAASVIARIAREMGILTVGVVTKPLVGKRPSHDQL
jgi:cell division GTPase FtsZ